MSAQEVAVVKIRGATFIPSAWISRPSEGDGMLEFKGDDREFTPHAVNTGRCRVEQEIVVDFTNGTLLSYGDTGQSVERITYPDGTEDRRSGKSSTSGLFCTDPQWHDDYVEFDMHASASNPLRAHADPVDFHLETVVWNDGAVYVHGHHDGFPCFEFYVQTDFGEFRPLYRHDYRETGDEPLALAGPMEYEFERSL